MKEIERKFLVKKMPDLSGHASVRYERYFLYKDGRVEMRIQQKGNRFEFERKMILSGLSSEKMKFEITRPEFEALKKIAGHSLIRDSYQLSDEPQISLKVYQGKFVGLIRAEAEFSSEKE